MDEMDRMDDMDGMDLGLRGEFSVVGGGVRKRGDAKDLAE
jgi:hypothetical protein